ncbi:hypothetical protein [Desulfurivibrio alkaliphilus]|uniref:Uncharacterized protein n=1 Tax=Desulfurivibrio alkaliphilus (strain DSM 19089 / UNIQEM U267 / AHT2) TaxID=589865 RepID=D6Z4X6_DESAT|nr:hypothetical protein [Desulfurivibrio alkaliphilus]ADH86601.1 conserved hypothetical protein [Desulfurivibrio alkaliphilus AHT 2]
MIVEIIDKLRARLPLLAKLALALLALLLLWDILLLDKTKAYTAAELLPGFWSLFGFGAAVVIIVVAKTIGLIGLQTDEDYYDK